MAKVVLYITNPCPFCVRAKNLLRSKGVNFEEVDLTHKPQELKSLRDQTGWRTVPQIFINGQFIGGYTDMVELDENGKLDSLLNQ